MADAGIDRSKIVRNAEGSEEPSSADPELWNMDGTGAARRVTVARGSVGRTFFLEVSDTSRPRSLRCVCEKAVGFGVPG